MPSLLPILPAVLGVTLLGLVTGLLFLGLDRILVARMQARIGPPLLQPFMDVGKLFTKENIVPKNAVKSLFHFAPVLALGSTLLLMLYLPIGPWKPVLAAHGDLILVVYLLIVPALAMVLGGFASSSPYATIGAQREMVTMISYELPLAATAIAIAWTLHAAGLEQPFNLATIAANPIWGVVGPVGMAGALILLATLLLVTPGELSRIPFDTPEAETELAGGLLVEYSGRNFALFYLSMGVKSIFMGGLVVALFLPWNLTQFIALPGWAGAAADLLFWLFKVELVLFFAATLIRISMARLRINHVVAIYWKYLGTLGLIGLALLMADAAMR